MASVSLFHIQEAVWSGSRRKDTGTQDRGMTGDKYSESLADTGVFKALRLEKFNKDI